MKPTFKHRSVTLQDLAEYSLTAAQQHISQRLLFTEPRPARRNDIARYFGPYRTPGTAPVGLRKSRPDLFQDTLADPIESYQSWLERTIKALLPDMTASSTLSTKRSACRIDPQDAVEKVARVLEWPTPDGVPFDHALPQQMYEDVFVRILAFISGKSGTATEPHRYRAFNVICRRLGSILLEVIDDRAADGGSADEVTRICRMAVLSGYVGINLKSSATAASHLLNRDCLPLQPEWVKNPTTARTVSKAALGDVAQQLLSLTDSGEGQFGLDSIADYHAEVIDAAEPTLLVFFSDDYLESMLDMKRFEWILARNPHLTLLFVPRAGRYGNDLAFEDVEFLLTLPTLKRFGQMSSAGRVRISEHGPRAGCLDPRDISSGLIEQIEKLAYGRRLIFETKGCRNFEMLRGELPFPWYAGFNCNRALSLRTVQVDGSPVFLRIPPHLKAYDGFQSPRIGCGPLNRNPGVRFAQMTTLDLYRALETPTYRHLCQRFSDENRLNRILATAAAGFQKPVSALLEDIAGGQTAIESVLASERPGRALSANHQTPFPIRLKYRPTVPPRFRNVTLGRLAFDLYQFLRAQRWMVDKFGRQFSRSLRFAEIDITYRCNLKCANCNRSCSQAPSSREMHPAQIETFIHESIAAGTRWERLRLLGGEPTLHSRFETILELLRAYKHDYRPHMRIVVCTNGFGRRVRRVLNRLPDDVEIKNTYKRAPDSLFRPFNIAPIDLNRFRWSDFASGCRIISECGVGFTPKGYYPCAVAGGIDRIFGLNLGRKKLPPPEDGMRDLMRSFCPLCGHFGFAWPTRRTKVSPTWNTAYRRYTGKRRLLQDPPETTPMTNER